MEEQLNELMAMVDEEQSRLVKLEDIAKIVYLRDCISDRYLQPYDYINIEAAKKRIIGKLQEREE